MKTDILIDAAGGTRGDFAREGPSVFIKEVRNHRDGR